jgi:hypothetical protein
METQCGYHSVRRSGNQPDACHSNAFRSSERRPQGLRRMVYKHLTPDGVKTEASVFAANMALLLTLAQRSMKDTR